ncbi:hypothetical protein GBQ70_15470 [Halomicrobium sp. ZPS1]|uniref:Uncharacterized protein n=1 Tax=Halomicrobium mukohataei TaxID=57705 RepID=A0A4D6KFH9_9EURY|nr:hypothetical protein E5139_15450 [Halomicrobium mukohataei]QFR21780.1 hypothetical protein GBQ70_15470 [Halomicrobium sp. ZPS1]
MPTSSSRRWPPTPPTAPRCPPTDTAGCRRFEIFATAGSRNAVQTDSRQYGSPLRFAAVELIPRD